MKRHVRRLKYDPWPRVKECEIVHVSPSYVVMPTTLDGTEHTVSLRDLALVPTREDQSVPDSPRNASANDNECPSLVLLPTQLL